MSGFEDAFAYPLPKKAVAPSDYADNDRIKLSGRILNVMPLLPTQVCKVDGENGPKWDVEPVRGNLALYSLHYFLDQQTEWETHLIGWTGELVDRTKGAHNRTVSDTLQEDPLYLKEDDKKGLEDRIRTAAKSENVHPIWLLRRDQLRWRRYAEDVIWPVFHYIQTPPSDGRAEGQAWHDYVRYNESYFQKLRALYKPGDVIWIHDYYLLLLPQLLRMEFPDAIIGLFVHAPFPSSEYFRCLSKRSQLLDGMLGADKIVFQLELFQRHFLLCCLRVLGAEVGTDLVAAYGLTISVETLPIGIDTHKTEHDAFSAAVDDNVSALRQIYHDKKIIVGRDRLDMVRGVVQKLQAFEMFLQMYPEWRDKVVLVQVSSPGFLHLAKIEQKVTELVNHINLVYGSLSSTPVLHYQMRIDKDEYFALLRVADLALITLIRDGMNTTSLEFVACQKHNHLPLVLLEFTGTSSVLSEAVLVNPWDSVGIAKTLHDCLLMLPEAKEQLESRLYEKVAANTVQQWSVNFVLHLMDHVTGSHHLHHTPALNRPLLLNNYRAAHRRLFLFDYDGTLTPIVKDPAAAIPLARLNSILDTLAADPKNRIWVISGRDQAFLAKWLGKKHVGLLAEHGCFMRDVGGEEWVNLAASFDMLWQKEVDAVFQYYTEKTAGSNIERKKVALTWHYRRADPELGRYNALKCEEELRQKVASKFDVEVMAGKANIEVRPRFVNKGEIVKRLVLNAHGAPQGAVHTISDVSVDELPDFVMCLGDDLTDEDMFRSLQHVETTWHLQGVPKNEFGLYGVYPVAVGPANRQTVATAHLTEPAQVLETLGLLAGQVSLFESAGLVDLDERGHQANSELLARLRTAKAAYLEKSSSRK